MKDPRQQGSKAAARDWMDFLHFEDDEDLQYFLGPNAYDILVSELYDAGWYSTMENARAYANGYVDALRRLREAKIRTDREAALAREFDDDGRTK